MSHLTKQEKRNIKESVPFQVIALLDARVRLGESKGQYLEVLEKLQPQQDYSKEELVISEKTTEELKEIPFFDAVLKAYPFQLASLLEAVRIKGCSNEEVAKAMVEVIAGPRDEESAKKLAKVIVGADTTDSKEEMQRKFENGELKLSPWQESYVSAMTDEIKTIMENDTAASSQENVARQKTKPYQNSSR